MFLVDMVVFEGDRHIMKSASCWEGDWNRRVSGYKWIGALYG